MTIASLIVDVGINILGLKGDVEKIHAQFDKIVNVAGKVAGALGLAFGAKQIIDGIKNLIQSTIAYADTLANLKAKTDLTYRDLQVLEDVGIDTGVSMQTLASAVQVLQLRLGDGSARKGLEALNLEFHTIRTMSPADQLTIIGTAIGKIEDPTLRAKLAAEVFGKTWKEMLPVLTANMADAAANAHILGDTQIDAADRASDRWAKFWNDQKRGWAAWVGNILITHEDASKIMAAARAQEEAIAGFVPNTLTLPSAPKLATGGGPWQMLAPDPAMISRIKIAGMTLDETAASMTRVTKAATEAAAAQKRFDDNTWSWVIGSGAAAGPVVDGLTSALIEEMNALQGVLQPSQDYQQLILDNSIQTDIFGNVLAANVIPHLQTTAGGFAQVTVESLTWREQLDNLSASFTQLATIGGDALSSVTRGIGTVISGFSVALTGIDSLKGGLKSLKAGDTMSGITSIISGIGGIVGAAQAAISAVKALWNWARGGEEGTIVNPARDAWFAQHGGLAGVNEAAFAATGNLGLSQAIFGADTKAEFDAAIAAWGSATGNSFAGGTRGLMDFGSGTMAMLHGKERVQTEAQVRSDDRRMDGLEREIRGLRKDFKLFNRQLRDAILMGS